MLLKGAAVAFDITYAISLRSLRLFCLNRLGFLVTFQSIKLVEADLLLLVGLVDVVVETIYLLDSILAALLQQL